MMRQCGVGLIRWDNEAAMAIFPPALSADRQWPEVMHIEER